MNGEGYREMIFDFFLAKMQEIDLHDRWFHTARVTMDLVRGEFGQHFISRSGPFNWPPRTCDLTPLDHFFGAMLKLISIQTSMLHYRPTYWEEYAKIGLRGWTI